MQFESKYNQILQIQFSFLLQIFFAVIADIAIINLYLHNHQESGLHADQCNLLSENTI